MTIMKAARVGIVAALCSMLCTRGVPGLQAGAAPGGYDRTDRYEVRAVEGWEVLINKRFLASNPELADRTLTLLRYQLYQIDRRLSAAAVKKLRAIRIWVEENEPHHPCMAYHPDSGWLRDHGMNPDKARCVEVANARNFLSWTLEQPWMVLHELAHGFHHQFQPDGFENVEIRAAYDQAVGNGSYKSVLRTNGDKVSAYAAENPMEYFAEATEAFFGTNDFFPFVRPELRQYDPKLYELLRKAWAEP